MSDNGEKLTVEVDRSPEIEALRKEKQKAEQERDEAKAQVEQVALEKLEEEKAIVKEMLQKSNLSAEQKQDLENQLESPKSLEIIKNMLSTIVKSEDPKKKAPAGKSTFAAPSGETYENEKEMVDALYFRAFHDKTVSAEDRQRAKDQINSLWKNLVEGPNYKKNMMKKPNMNREFTDCPNPSCKRTLENFTRGVCPYCGYKIDGRHRTYTTPPTVEGPDAGKKVF